MCPDDKVESVEAAGDAKSILRAAILGEMLTELFVFLSLKIPAPVKNGFYAGIYIITETIIEFCKIKKTDHDTSPS